MPAVEAHLSPQQAGADGDFRFVLSGCGAGHVTNLQELLVHLSVDVQLEFIICRMLYKSNSLVQVFAGGY
jgi:hypothetical protein